MKLLLSNDDGVYAEGLAALAAELSQNFEIAVVAPERDHSGASNSLTLNRPLILQKATNGFSWVDGTPTDAVHLGLSRIFDFSADRVVSGINSHANLGDDVLYSGTVAAAMEGRFLQYPAIAVSLVNAGNNHYATAARVVRNLLENPKSLTLAPRTVLNINVPDLPYEQLRGIRVTRLGHRAKTGHPLEVTDPRGRKRFWLALAGDGDDAGEGTDFDAVKTGFVSVTPIHADMTRHDAFDSMVDWISAVEETSRG